MSLLNLAVGVNEVLLKAGDMLFELFIFCSISLQLIVWGVSIKLALLGAIVCKQCSSPPSANYIYILISVGEAYH